MPRGATLGPRPSASTDRPASAAAGAFPSSPAATRAARRTLRDPRLAIGVVVVALSALLGARLLGGADDTVAVWTTRHAVSAGQPLTAADLVGTRVRFADQAAADAYLSADRPPADGATAARALGAGELLPRAAVGSSAEGSLTEVPLSVATDAVPASVRAGSVVDVWVTADPARSARAAGAARSTLVLEDVTVVAAPATRTSLGPSASRQVVVGVDEAQRAGLPAALAALAGGAVTLTVRR